MDLLQNCTLVFLEKCKTNKVADEHLPELEYTFNELMDIMSMEEGN